MRLESQPFILQMKSQELWEVKTFIEVQVHDSPTELEMESPPSDFQVGAHPLSVETDLLEKLENYSLCVPKQFLEEGYKYCWRESVYCHVMLFHLLEFTCQRPPNGVMKTKYILDRVR